MSIKDDLHQQEQQLSDYERQRLAAMRQAAVSTQETTTGSYWRITLAAAASFLIAIPLALMMLSEPADQSRWVDEDLLDNVEVYDDDIYYEFMLAEAPDLSQGSRLRSLSDAII